MRATSKGQVTIPIEIREALGILPETELKFSVRGDEGVFNIVAPRTGRPSRGERLVALLANSATDRQFTTDEILSMTRGDD